MINVRHYVAASRIPGSGDGFFIAEEVSAGRVIVAPKIDRVLSWSELGALPAGSIEQRTSIRWFEDRYAVNDQWTPECFINHSFEPNALVHLGFVFARRQLDAGAEITIDYRLFLGEGYRMPFTDGETGEPIIGFSWAESISRSSSELARILG